MTLEAAIDRVETQLTRNPDDLQGWTVVAPAYMQTGRFRRGRARLSPHSST
jgi:cytochrome c-type biogenesis protein CcmH